MSAGGGAWRRRQSGCVLKAGPAGLCRVIQVGFQRPGRLCAPSVSQRSQLMALLRHQVAELYLEEETAAHPASLPGEFHVQRSLAAAHPSILAWRIPWTEESGSYPP